MRCHGLKLRMGAGVLALCLLPACADDDRTSGQQDAGESEASSEADDAADDWTSESESESESGDGDGDGDGDEGTEETGEEPQLDCGEILECLTGCITNLGLDCLAECGANADPAELDEVGALVACIGGVCVEKGECDFVDSFDQASCIGCIGLGLILPEPPGCEAEAAICQGEEPPGDGDGDTTGDGDGDGTGDGDGDGDTTTGDGDGDTSGDGDGDSTTGDGDGDGDCGPDFTCTSELLTPAMPDPCYLENAAFAGKNLFELYIDCVQWPQVSNCNTEDGWRITGGGPGPGIGNDLELCGQACTDFVANGQATWWDCPLP